MNARRAKTGPARHMEHDGDHQSTPKSRRCHTICKPAPTRSSAVNRAVKNARTTDPTRVKTEHDSELARFARSPDESARPDVLHVPLPPIRVKAAGGASCAVTAVLDATPRTPRRQARLTCSPSSSLWSLGMSSINSVSDSDSDSDADMTPRRWLVAELGGFRGPSTTGFPSGHDLTIKDRAWQFPSTSGSTLGHLGSSANDLTHLPPAVSLMGSYPASA